MQPRLLRDVRCRPRCVAGFGFSRQSRHWQDAQRPHHNAFSEYLIKNGPISKDLGRLLKRAEEIRLVADYKGDSVELSDAREMVAQAQTFVTDMHVEFMPDDRSEDNNGMEP